MRWPVALVADLAPKVCLGFGYTKYLEKTLKDKGRATLVGCAL